MTDADREPEYLQILRDLVEAETGTAPLEVFLRMRRACDAPVHGPEHHALVPAAFLAAYRNLHGAPEPAVVWEAVCEAAELPGGTCGTWGACAAALGIGIAYCAILDAGPLSEAERGQCHEVVGEILGRIGRVGAARCCRRESMTALVAACELSGRLLPGPVACGPWPTCDQAWANEECIFARCDFAHRPEPPGA